jgi:excisionase family DNA binding protein
MPDNFNDESKRPFNKEHEIKNVVRVYRPVETTLSVDLTGASVIMRFSFGEDGFVPADLLPKDNLPPKTQVHPQQMEIYTTKEVAKSLGCSRKKVRKLITDGFLEALPGGPPYRITKESLDRYLRGQYPRKSPDPSASDVGSAHVAAPEPFVRKSVQRPLPGITTRPGKPSEVEVQRAVEDMKSWKK